MYFKFVPLLHVPILLLILFEEPVQLENSVLVLHVSYCDLVHAFLQLFASESVFALARLRRWW